MNYTKDEKRRYEILNGNLLKIVISICAPLFIYNLFDAFYAIIDAIIVSKINPESVSTVAILSEIKNLISSLGAGIAAGSGILVARSFGAGNMERARKLSNMTLLIASILGAILLITCIPFSGFIMRISGVPNELIPIGSGYFIVQIICIVFMLFNSIFIAMQKAKGNTRIILIFNIVSMITKLGLSFLFVYGLKFTNIIWVGIATLISQILLFIIFLIMMSNKNDILQIRLKEFKISWVEFCELFKISFPIFLGKFIFSFGKVSINAMCKNYGALVAGALGVSGSLCSLSTKPGNTFEDCTSTIVAQNLGNNNLKRALSAFWRSLFVSVSLGILGYVLITFAFQDQLIALFNQSQTENGEEFLQIIKSIYKYDSLTIIALSINAPVLGVLYGFGRTKTTMIINISRVFVFRIPTLWYLQNFHKELGSEAAGISMAISNCCIALMSIICLVIFVLKIKKKGYNEMTLDKETK